MYSKPEIESILAEHQSAPEKRFAQQALAKGVTEVVHGITSAKAAINLTELLFGNKKIGMLSATEIEGIALLLPTLKLSDDRPKIALVDALVETELASSKTEARQLIKQNAISINGEKITDDTLEIQSLAILKRGKNKFALVK